VFFGKRKTAPPAFSTAHVIQWNADEIPRYPPFMKGLPVVPPDKLLETQHDLIARITDAAMDGTEAVRRHYLPAMQRFASFAHLLPASQSHHHRGAGGLLRHSMEVALWALQSADKVLLDAAKAPSRRREIEPRWQLAVFLAALCHDAGKPVTDLTVTNSDRTAVWRPIKEDLYTWATNNGIDAYFLDWREGRSRQHTALSNLIGDRIIGSETLEWIEEGDTELIVWLMESLNCNPTPTNRIYDLVVKADQTSVERDLKTLGVAMAGYDLGVPVERHLTDIMRRFVKETIWRVNEPGARLWNIGGNLYLVWPAAGEEIARQVAEDGIPGIPRTSDGILDMLVDRQIAFVRDGTAPGERYWRIAPDILAEKIPGIQLPAIRLRDEAMVSSIPIHPVAGKIVNEAVDNPADHPDGEPARDTQPPIQTESGQSVAPAVVTTQASAAPETDKPRDGVEKNGKPVAPESRPARGNQPGLSEGAGKAKPEGGAAGAEPPRKEPRSEPVARREAPAVMLDGAVGEALKALAQDLQSGEKQWGHDAVLDPENQLRLRWPDAFSGYGLTPRAILDDLSSRGWLWIDPMAPLKKLLDTEIGGFSVKTIRLEPEISAALVREAGGVPQAQEVARIVGGSTPRGGSDPEPVPAPDPDLAAVPAPHQPEVTGLSGKTQKGKARKARPDSGEASPQGQDQRKGGEHPSGTAGMVAKKESSAGESKGQMPSGTARISALPSLEAVIAAIQDISGQLEVDGRRAVSKIAVMAACKARGIKLSHSSLAALSAIEPERFALENGIVRFKP
jgi:conjugal transfer pilus assembly protein TraI